MPYANHIMTLSVTNKNIHKEISFAALVCQVFITCGKNVMEDMVPAAIPNISIAFIKVSFGILFLLHEWLKLNYILFV
jgi:hypothetical protein